MVTDTVVLHAAGGPAIGVGHLARTAALAQAIRKRYDNTRVTLVWEAAAVLIAHFDTEGVSVILVENRQGAMETLAWLSCRQAPSLLVTDLLELEPAYYHSARNEGYQLLAHINDSGEGRRVADIIIDEDPIPSPVPQGFYGHLLIGAEYRIIGDNIRQKRPSVSWSKKEVYRILLTLGGADPGGISAQLLETLLYACPHPDFDLTVLAGPSFAPALLERLMQQSKSTSRVQVLKPVDDIATLMLEHDLIITLGGITSYEAMCLGRPVACVRYNHMGTYVERLASEGLVADLGENTEVVPNLLNLMLDTHLLASVAEKAYQSIDGRGVDRVAEQLIQLLHGED